MRRLAARAAVVQHDHGARLEMVANPRERLLARERPVAGHDRAVDVPEPELARDRPESRRRAQERRAPVHGRHARNLLDERVREGELVADRRLVELGEVAVVAVGVVADLVALVDETHQRAPALVVVDLAAQDEERAVTAVAGEVVEDRARPSRRSVVEREGDERLRALLAIGGRHPASLRAGLESSVLYKPLTGGLSASNRSWPR